MIDPRSHLTNPRTRAQYTADIYIHLHIIYSHIYMFLSASVINISGKVELRYDLI